MKRIIFLLIVIVVAILVFCDYDKIKNMVGFFKAPISSDYFIVAGSEEEGTLLIIVTERNDQIVKKSKYPKVNAPKEFIAGSILER